MDVLVESARGYLELTGRRVLGKMTDSLRPGGGEFSKSVVLAVDSVALVVWFVGGVDDCRLRSCWLCHLSLFTGTGTITSPVVRCRGVGFCGLGGEIFRASPWITFPPPYGWLLLSRRPTREV